MSGLDHHFHLVNLSDFGHDEWWKGHELTGGVAIYDDHLAYMSDTLRWIESYNSAQRKPFEGLCWYGPTVIRKEGAKTTFQIFNAWAELFRVGPEILNLEGYYVFDSEHPEGYFDRLKIPRDEIVSKLTTIASYAQKIIDSDGQYFILHMGI